MHLLYVLSFTSFLSQAFFEFYKHTWNGGVVTVVYIKLALKDIVRKR